MREILENAWGYFRRNGWAVAGEISVNFAMPYIIYSITHEQLGDVRALMAASAPPIVWSIFEFLRHRRVDAISLFVLFGIVLSLLAFVGGGSVHVLQLREKLVTVVIGVLFLCSAAIGRPLIYEFARASMIRKNSSGLEAFEARRSSERFRRAMTLMTLVWGFGLLADAAVSVALIYNLSIRHYLIVGPIIGYGTLGALALWTFWYVRLLKRQRKAEVQCDADGQPSHG